MPKYLLSLALVIVCAGCAHPRPARTVALAPNPVDVRMLTNPSVTSASLDAALPQFSRGAPPIFLRSERPIYTVEQGLPEVQRVAKQPLLAMTEYNGWLWYATDVTPDGNNQSGGMFRSGYAVQKGGFLAWRW
jgi:hypothetical protein